MRGVFYLGWCYDCVGCVVCIVLCVRSVNWGGNCWCARCMLFEYWVGFF